MRVNATEMPLVHCPLGGSVEFYWDGTPDHHDVWQLFDQDSYINCRFNSGRALRRRTSGTSGVYRFNCDSVGGHFFACSVSDACSKGLQRVRVHVTDPSKTEAVRAQIDPITGTNYLSLAEVCATYIFSNVIHFCKRWVSCR